MTADSNRPTAGSAKARGRAIAVAGLLLVIGSSLLPAQYYYEKNKVQTRDYDFKTITTTHFQIYFYTGGEVLADYTSRIAEEYYAGLSKDLGVSREDRIPIIIYNSPNEFEETNIVTDIVEEGVGGFSELFKNRVVVPFDGSYARFKKVLWHEITHIFEFEMFYKPRLASLLSISEEFQIPLWVAEGFSEFASGNAELGNEIFMRDLVINNRLLAIDQLNDYYGYLAYREGEAIFRYIEERYGRKKVFQFLHQLKAEQNVGQAFDKTFGLSTKKFSKEFEERLRQEYWPKITRKSNFPKLGTLLTNHVDDGSVYNTAPAISPSGSMVAFISDRNEYSDVYVISALDGKVIKHLISGERSGGFESVHPYRGGLSWAPDETRIAVASKSQGKDCLAEVEFPSGRVKKRWFPNVGGIYSPKYSPDGRKLAFVGLKDGGSDIFVLDRSTGGVTRVTADIYEDRDPTFSASGDTILFVSDRPDSGAWHPGSYALFCYTSYSAVSRVTPRAEYLAHPTFLPGDQKLAFVTSDSSYDLDIFSLAEGRVVERTNFLGGVYYPTFSQDGTRLIFAYYENMGWDIASIKDPQVTLPSARESTLVASSDTASYEKNEPDRSRVKRYGFNLSPDYAYGAAGYSSDIGLSGQLNLALSDALGNHRFYLQADLLRDLVNSDFYLDYWYLPKRFDIGAGFYQYFDYGYDWAGDAAYLRRNLGLQGLAAYPFDHFTRLEFDPSFVYSEYNWYHYDPVDDAFYSDSTAWKPQVMLDGALVFDNSYWGSMTAPERGTRARLEVYAPAVGSRFVTGYLDARNYLKIAKRYIWANRFLALASFGPDAERYYLGGEDVRGYQYAEFFDRPGTKALVLSSELRYPFVDRLKIAFPLPLDITDIRGVMFADAGMVWDKKLPVVYQNNRLQDLKVGIGAGARLQISWFALKLDFGYPLSALSMADSTRERTRQGTWYFSIGTDF